VRERCEREPEALKQGSGFVLYALMDAVVDRYFPIVDSMESELEGIEERIFDRGAARFNIERLYDLKRRVTVVKHAVAPLMEAVSKLASGRAPPVSTSSRHYFRDVYDHLARINAHLDILRDTIGTAIQVSLSSVAIEQNDVAKRLAAWAGIFAVATAFAGIWGMNFESMPELQVGIRLSAGADADRWRHGISFLPLSAPGLAMTNNGRPDPDQLLARVQEEEAKAARGKLKIFFGASAGVGKTYAMLGAARRQKELGTDVVIGVVETHGRKETEALITGLERLPLCEIPYRGSVLKEFDLDAALARRPALILMDELAHSNVAGSRHPKRWQDIHDLLAAGIDVYSTVNVQHLETLNDVVSGIAGIRVWETVPDRIFDEADEVVLVDLPPDDLLQRLKEGKVYLPQQAERAIRNFFRKGNLIALRELALRRTADRVDDEMLAYRRETSVATVWQTRDAAAGVHRIGHRGGATGAHRGAPGRATGGPLARHPCAHANLGTGARGGTAAHRPRARTIRFPRCRNGDTLG
jgi:hypothetical protein